MFITKKHLGRRTFLRGMGATVGLPLLDAMVPALATTVEQAPMSNLVLTMLDQADVPTESLGDSNGTIAEL